MSILDAIRDTAANWRARHRMKVEDSYVFLPQSWKPEMIARSGTVAAELETMSPENRARMAALGYVGVEFDSVLAYRGKPVRDLHRWPWLEQQDTERAWWQAIA